MSETATARQFLATLDAQPVRITSDHVEDPRQYPARAAYIMPKMPRPMSKRPAAVAPGQEPCIDIRLSHVGSGTTSKEASLDMTLSNQPLTTTIGDVKRAIQDQTGTAPADIRLLYQKKPCTDGKTIQDLGAERGQKEIELRVMLAKRTSVEDAARPGKLGPEKEAEGKEPGNNRGGEGDAAKASALGVLGKEDFWSRLGRFLSTTLPREREKEWVLSVFRKAWERERSS
ncbi:MAG: hypothetical protein M1826_006302 [Phylliscum demangeonii]|nr:MAG: hypothetical protein M1826_006302 [Phylliscum demangeonii]